MRFKIEKGHLVLALCVFAFTMAFAVYTQHAWEDWYITFKASKNLATGQGLSFTPGQHVHTFTSVAGTLVPAFLSFITFNQSDDLVLWLFRILNSGMLAFSAVLLAKASGKWFVGIIPTVLLVGNVVLDSKTVDFVINGMETSYTILGLSLFLYIISVYPAEKLGWRLGAVWALLQYARPDGFIFSGLLVLGLLLFMPNRRALLRPLAISIAVSIVLFLPWFLFALWYYGTVIPHSMVAKSALISYDMATILGKAWTYLVGLLFLDVSLQDFVFLPANVFATPPASMVPLYISSRVLGTVASLLWLIPSMKPMGRIASLTFLGFSLYLESCAPYVAAWYIPGLTLMGGTALAFGLDAFLPLLRRLKIPSGIAGAVGSIIVALLLFFTLSLTLVSAHQFRHMQRIIEREHRQKIGAWLKANAASPNETVLLECVGYIGFYSGLKMYDWPGMTSPEMVSARKTVRSENFAQLIRLLRPDWLVLRPVEASRIWNADSLYLQRNYMMRKIFDVNKEIDAIQYKPFEEYLRGDAVFIVISKQPQPLDIPGRMPLGIAP